MTPERWREIEQTYQSAMDLDAEGRKAFLEEACSGDEALRHEVESLLELSDSQVLVDQPAWDLALELLEDDAELAPGTELGHYRIEHLAGAGVMGKVYRATDTQLNRYVAVKVSPVEFGERFTREARAIAALNHPNICAVYEVGPNYLVMELVGEMTLSQRIKEAPISPDEVLEIARQIASALATAHENGVVHRDLRPDNIRFKPDGTVKVLDFGLAKSEEAAAPDRAAAYRSPEQLGGKPVDRRTDIWSFGVVFYEMLTARPLFARKSHSDTVAAVLEEEPKWDRIPHKFQRLLRNCLQKDPGHRLRDIGDAWLLLEDKPRAISTKQTWLAWSAAVLLFTALAPIAVVHFRERPPVPSARVQFEVQLPGMTNSPWFSISPDGRRLVFVANGSDGVRRLWIRTFDSVEARPLAGSETSRNGIRHFPFWSPDSRYVAFDAGGKLKKIDVSSGAVQTLCDVPGNIAGGSWNQDGVIIFGVDESGYGVMRVSADGGEPTQVTNPEQSTARHVFPVLLPDGKHFLYRRNGSPEGIYAGSLDAKPEEQPGPVLLQSDNTTFSYQDDPDSAEGQLLFMRDGVLLAQTFDAERLQVVGEPVRIVEDADASENRGIPLGVFSVSNNNVLVYTSEAGRSLRLSWFDRHGTVLKHLGQSAHSVAISPDGTKIAFAQVIDPPRDGAIWLMDVASGLNSQLTFSSGLELYPVWSADATRLAFTFFPGDASGYSGYQKLSNGMGTEEPLINSKPTVPSDWSRDGDLLYWVRDPKTKSDLWVMPAGSGKAFPVLATESNELYGKFSPDGRSVAYVSDESGEEEVYVVPFALTADGHPLPQGGKNKVSTNGGVGVHWRRDGNELFYLSPDGTMMGVEVKTASDSGQVLQYGTPQRLFQTTATNPFAWDVAPDGSRFLIAEQAETSPPPTVVVLNWRSLLKN